MLFQKRNLLLKPIRHTNVIAIHPRNKIPARKLQRLFIAGLANDYLGYLLTPASYRRPSYIACGSLYGERGGEIVRDAALAALRRLAPLRSVR